MPNRMDVESVIIATSVFVLLVLVSLFIGGPTTRMCWGIVIFFGIVLLWALGTCFGRRRTR